MKKFFSLALAVVLVGVSGVAVAGVVGSKHDLTTATGTAFSTTGNTAEVCVFCHTPHSSSTTAQPLWNRGASAASYTMYNSAWSSTIDMTVAASPQGVSAACLSCHDGTVAFDVLINASGSGGYNAAGASQGWTFTGANSLSGRGRPTEIGADLRYEHPISVTYDTAADTAFNAAAGGKVGTLPLYGASANQVECGTCHDPHDVTNAPFLRMSNAASALCTTCHIK